MKFTFDRKAVLEKIRARTKLAAAPAIGGLAAGPAVDAKPVALPGGGQTLGGSGSQGFQQMLAANQIRKNLVAKTPPKIAGKGRVLQKAVGQQMSPAARMKDPALPRVSKGISAPSGPSKVASVNAFLEGAHLHNGEMTKEAWGGLARAGWQGFRSIFPGGARWAPQAATRASHTASYGDEVAAAQAALARARDGYSSARQKFLQARKIQSAGAIPGVSSPGSVGYINRLAQRSQMFRRRRDSANRTLRALQAKKPVASGQMGQSHYLIKGKDGVERTAWGYISPKLSAGEKVVTKTPWHQTGGIRYGGAKGLLRDVAVKPLHGVGKGLKWGGIGTVGAEMMAPAHLKGGKWWSDQAGSVGLGLGSTMGLLASGPIGVGIGLTNPGNVLGKLTGGAMTAGKDIYRHSKGSQRGLSGAIKQKLNPDKFKTRSKRPKTPPKAESPGAMNLQRLEDRLKAPLAPGDKPGALALAGRLV